MGAHMKSSLVNAADLVGAEVYGHSGEKLGAIKAIYLDERSGQVEFVCLACGGVLGLNETHYPAPWSALRFDPDVAGYRTSLDRAALDAGPGFGGARGDPDWASHARAYHAKLAQRPPQAEAPHTRPIEPEPDEARVDHLAERLERSEDRQEALLDEALEESFPASDSVSVKRIT
jgi:hypothetical protein